MYDFASSSNSKYFPTLTLDLMWKDLCPPTAICFFITLNRLNRHIRRPALWARKLKSTSWHVNLFRGGKTQNLRNSVFPLAEVSQIVWKTSGLQNLEAHQAKHSSPAMEDGPLWPTWVLLSAWKWQNGMGGLSRIWRATVDGWWDKCDLVNCVWV